jgi:CheY-like chemotaxis protein
MTGNSDVALLIRRGVLAGGSREGIPAYSRRDQPAAKMKEPKPELESLSAMMAETEHFEILLAEDKLEDAELVRVALKEHGVECTLRLIRDGAEAIAFLGTLDADPKSPALDLLIADMNLPKRSGEDILKCLRSTENYAQTPVIVMSGLIAGATEEKATRHAAIVCFQKPSTLDGFMQLGSIVRNVLQKQTKGAP